MIIACGFLRCLSDAFGGHPPIGFPSITDRGLAVCGLWCLRGNHFLLWL
jgi:hypothetical protein